MTLNAPFSQKHAILRLFVLIVGLFVLIAVIFSARSLRGDSIMPHVCVLPGDNKASVQRLAEIAYQEALQKGISLKNYNQVFAVIYRSRNDRSRKAFIVRFSPFRCGELGLDGGGFDVEIDPITLKVLDSYLSSL